MTLRIIHRATPINVTQVIVAIIGQPGLGKTSLGFSAERPLLLDFDAGAHRSAFRQDSVLVDTWEQVSTLDREELAPYATVVADTAGRALDKITDYIVRTQPKMAQSSGALTLKGYGELKAIFTGWVKRLRELGKDIVILAHDAEEKDGDDVRVRPDMQGGSRQELAKVSDLLGFLHMQNKKRTLDFNPSDKWFAKNCAGLPVFEVPNLHEQPDFLATVIARTKEALNRQSVEQQKAGEEMAALKAQINAAASPAEFNGLLPAVKAADPAIQDALKRLLVTAAKGLGVTFDKAAGAFVGGAPAAVAG